MWVGCVCVGWGRVLKWKIKLFLLVYFLSLHLNSLRLQVPAFPSPSLKHPNNSSSNRPPDKTSPRLPLPDQWSLKIPRPLNNSSSNSPLNLNSNNKVSQCLLMCQLLPLPGSNCSPALVLPLQLVGSVVRLALRAGDRFPGGNKQVARPPIPRRENRSNSSLCCCSTPTSVRGERGSNRRVVTTDSARCLTARR